MSADLIAFLRARLDEDELAASTDERRFAEPDTGRAWIVRYDQDKVLAHIEDKRSKVAQLERHDPSHQDHPKLQFAVRSLATRYAKHPDYREEWRP